MKWLEWSSDLSRRMPTGSSRSLYLPFQTQKDCSAAENKLARQMTANGPLAVGPLLTGLRLKAAESVIVQIGPTFAGLENALKPVIRVTEIFA